MTCPHSSSAEWYNCMLCHREAMQNDTLQPKHIEKLLMQSAVGFAIAAILGAIVPHPYNSFSLFAVAIAFLVSGAFSKSAKNLSLKYRLKEMQMFHIHRWKEISEIQRVCRCGKRQIYSDTSSSEFDFWTETGWFDYKGTEENWQNRLEKNKNVEM